MPLGPADKNARPDRQAKLTAAAVKRDLRKHVNPEKATFYPGFFKTGPGQYGEGDKFLGVVVPDQRKIARQYKRLPTSEIDKLLSDPLHECRMTGLLILVAQFENASTADEQHSIVDYYLNHLDAVNNWDLVDATAHKILGAYLMDQPNRNVLYELAGSNHLWRQRIAVVSTYWFIQRGDFADTLELAEQLIDHPHDLIHKAIGWMLREVGKQQPPVLIGFLNRNYKKMPRTMLRYSIERLSAQQKSKYMRK